MFRDALRAVFVHLTLRKAQDVDIFSRQEGVNVPPMLRCSDSASFVKMLQVLFSLTYLLQILTQCHKKNSLEICKVSEHLCYDYGFYVEKFWAWFLC